MSATVACSLLYVLCSTVNLSGALPSSAALTSRETHPQHRGLYHHHTAPNFTDREKSRLSTSEGNFVSRDSYRNRATQNSFPNLKECHRDRAIQSPSQSETGSKRLRRMSEDYLCGDGYCCCDGTSADCSWHEEGLSYVPALPDTIRTLHFRGNKLRSIENKQFFANVSGVAYLVLSANDITFINSEALTFLRNLTTLILEGNRHLSHQALKAVFSVPTIQFLRLVRTGLGPILPVDVVPKSPVPQLQTLELDNNHLTSANLSVLTPFFKIEKIDLSLNSIGYGLASGYLPNLQRLILNWASLYIFPQTCQNGTSLFPRLVDLQLNQNSLSAIPTDVCLPSLNVLSLANNLFLIVESHWFSSHSFPVLKTLDLESNTFLRQINKNAFSNPSLQTLGLTYCRLQLAYDPVLDADSFVGCENLQHLQLSFNSWGFMTDSRFKRLFGNLSNLRWLELESVGLDQITAETFSFLKNLESLNLQHNKLSELPDGAFDGMDRLTKLWLNGNKITVVRPTTFGEHTRNRLHDLDISNNPFSCSCDVLWFQQWLVNHPSLFYYSWGQYTCANIPHLHVQSFHMQEQACLFSHQTSLLIIVIIVLVLSVSTLGTLLYRCRWHLRLLLYEAYRGKGERWRRLQEEHFQYDVFVSYDSDDVEWVLNVLKPELEDRWGLRLCIHQRDFIPGRNIVDNIETCVVASKKVMMIFSKNFADSDWCQFELNLCLRHVMDYDDVLLVVLMHDIPSRDLTPSMMAVMHTTTYIEWGRSPDAVAAFWGRLHIALHEIMV